MLFQAKSAVSTDVTFELALLTGYVLRAWADARLGPFLITSLNDGAHRPGSLHFTGNAVDIRTRHLWTGSTQPPFPGRHPAEVVRFAGALKEALTPHGVTIILHPDDDLTRPRHFPHLHLEYNPKPAQGRTLWTRE